ncbi:Uncharacterised protein [Vibrio cholerae]|nr:Uncharacterised protein [Vibrio cholerae]
MVWRQSAIACSTAGFTCSGLIAENGGRSVKVRSGFDIKRFLFSIETGRILTCELYK